MVKKSAIYAFVLTVHLLTMCYLSLVLIQWSFFVKKLCFLLHHLVLWSSQSLSSTSASILKTQPVSVYGPKSFCYFPDFIGRHSRLTSSQQSILLRAASHSLIPSTVHPITQFPSVIIIQACVLKCISR